MTIFSVPVFVTWEMYQQFIDTYFSTLVINDSCLFLGFLFIQFLYLWFYFKVVVPFFRFLVLTLKNHIF